MHRVGGGPKTKGSRPRAVHHKRLAVPAESALMGAPGRLMELRDGEKKEVAAAYLSAG